ncbi:unnamed protein product [Brachionus calyciflorus]|uniref:Kinesin-like protein n=1 Tax=Brachionus calyciflorus TaxID=104777 RepID=A0A813UU59_9BILA|nr:unnamed protein product [Brachionus calyciflorus]
MSKKLKTAARVDPVEVYCRIRPLNNENDESCLKILDESNLMLQIPECSASYRSGQIKQLVYSFTQIFDDQTSQKQLFEQVALPLVQDLLNGKNGLLFTYGVTGSGKTYSMIGNQHESGMLQRSLDTLFQSIQDKQVRKNFFKADKMNSFEIQGDSDAPRLSNNFTNSSKLNKQQQNFYNELQLTNKFQCQINKDNYFSVYLSCIEIYNNYIYDLLDDFSSSSTPTSQSSNQQQNIDLKESKNLKEDSKGCMYIKDVNEIECKSTEEALDLISKAQKKRVVAYTELNSESSRSHSIFNIRVVQSSCLNRQAPVFVSQLSLVDLAGSERTKRTKNTGSRLREAGSINSSLMALRNCMETLRENSLSGTRKMVPYRDSKLTLLFKNYFEGNGKIKMILCINPNSIEFDETSNVLKFSDLVRDVLPNMNSNPTGKIPKSASVNSNLNFKITFDELENNNLALLNNLQQNNYSLMNESFPPLDIFSPDDDQTIKRIIDYLEEFQRRRDALIHETDLIKQQFYVKLREINDELDRLKEERNEYKTRLDQKEKEQTKFDNKIKALEKIINTNNGYHRTPLTQTTNQYHSGSTGSRNYAMNTPNTGVMSSCSSTNNSGNTLSDKPISSSSMGNSSGGGGVGETPVRTRIANVNSAVKSSTSSQTPSGRVVGSILNSAAYNRYQTPAKQTPLAKEGVPVANRRQRRSKSAETWLDHKPPTVTKTDTVLQPKMQRKKSVSKVELNDAKKSSKYVLTHQQQDDNGEIRTNLIKGDILRSPSGGANVIFTDIETLETRQQEIGRPIKRPFECDNPMEDRNIIEERCSIAIEGHSSFTKTRTIANI